jgi:DNA polymerase I
MIEKQAAHQPHLLLIDGYGFVFRAYHSLPPLTRKDGTPVGAVLGFTNMLLKMVSGHKADYIAVVFDAGRKTFRSEIYPEYKANRPPAPDDLIPQFPLVREAATAMNIPIIEMEGYEADDIIATYARLSRDKGCKLTIVSSDKDLMQLIGDDGIEMYDPMKNKIIGIKEVQEKFGVTPDKVLDVLSLMGDSSDNIPGVPGIGPKTAAELVLQFGNLDEILKRAGEIKQNKRRETIIENTDKALLSRTLVKLCDTVPLELDSDFTPLEVKEIDYNQFYIFLKTQGFRSLIAKIEGKIDAATLNLGSTHSEIPHDSNNQAKPQAIAAHSPLPERNSHLISNAEHLKEFIGKYNEIETLAIYFDIADRVRGIAISINNADVAYIQLAPEQKTEQGSLFGDAPLHPLPMGEGRGEGYSKSELKNHIKSLTIDSKILDCLRPLLTDKTILKIGHDFKETYKILLQNNVIVQPLDDVMLMSYVMGAGAHSHDLQALTNLYLDSPQAPDDKTIAKMEDKQLAELMCSRLSSISDLHVILKHKLFTEKCLTLYENMEKPMLALLAEMELSGICLDTAKLKEQSRNFAEKIASLEKQIHALAECEFNIGSPKQLGDILFNKMGLDAGKKSKKSGAQSTDVRVLTELAENGHEIASLILEWRHFSKLKSTYTDSLPKQIGADGRVHTHFLLASTSTGRLSSTDPNLQNIPIRSEEGNRIREAFVAAKGCKLISADYSQIELRLLAAIAKIDTLKQAFKNGMDIHAVTASQMFGVPVDAVTAELRRRAKTINFGIIYGISAFGLAQRLGIGRTEAADYIKKYFLQYPGIEAYMKDTIEFARTHGYVETLFGRKCYIKGITDKNAAIRQFSERAAINAPLQGSAADIIKKAMVRLHLRLKEEGFASKILLQVHDELILEVPEHEIEPVKKIVKYEMEAAITLDVPLTAEAGVGNNWREAH